jgi:hypothetical protein
MKLEPILFWVFVGFVLLFLLPSIRIGQASVLFRSWIPSWRFFENLGTVPVLFVRVQSNLSLIEDARWVEALMPPRKSLLGLFLNPEGNKFHAYETLVRSYSLEPENEVLRSQIQRLALQEALKLDPKAKAYQFKIALREQSTLAQVSFQDQLISSVCEVV